MNGPYLEITNISFLAKLFFKTTYIVLIKEGGSERCDFMVYTINWFKKCSILITVLTLSN
jgi:hypothetical protein